MLCWSGYGHTRRICERIRAVLQTHGHAVEVADLGGDVDLAAWDAIVIGASIRHGRHDASVIDFIRRHQPLLAAKPSAFFSVSLVARKPTKNRPETNPYVQAFVAASPWKPRLLGVFGGELDYQRYGAFDRAAIRFIMWLTKGPRDPHTKVEFTDWAEVERFAGRVHELAADGRP